jgi:uncharacterized membrane protein
MIRRLPLKKLSIGVITGMFLFMYPIAVTSFPSKTSPTFLAMSVVVGLPIFPFGLGFHVSGPKSTHFRQFNGNGSKQQNRFPDGRFAFSTSGQHEQVKDIAADQDDDDDDDDHNPFHNNPDIPQDRLIEVSSRIELPFSASVAYDAYADLPRQPTWSSWLESVTVSEETPGESVWTMRFWGIRYSWTAVAVRNERPRLIQWKSITGLENFGTVRFYPRDEHSTLMTMKMTFVAPRAVSVVFKKSTRLAQYVENKVITKSLHNFRDKVLRVDLKQP